MRVFGFLGFIAVIFLCPALAAAQPSSADRATARELGKDGEALLARRDYGKALDRFARAEELFHAPTLLLGMARAQVGLGKLVDAQESYRRILNEPLASNAPAAFRDAQDAAKGELASLAPRIAWITITASGAESPTIKLDGQTLSAAAFGARRAVDPGTHEIVAEVRGTVVKRATVTLAEGKSETVPLDLKPQASAAAAAAAPESKPLPSETPGTPDVAPGASSSVRRTLGFASLGIGGAGILLGVGTGVAVLVQHKSLAADCPGGRCPLPFVPKMNTYNALGAASTGGFIAGGVLAATGVVLVVTAPKPAAHPVGVSVLTIPGGGVFVVKGSLR
jgi:hypothetical protein